ncbi:hypothetical protein [Sphingomonas adhaesiva]|uniref:hypothetical protein n=1 Tax=Sphingomonas adhaesiva TaxID=28212 RepID=UPI002FF5F3B0
MNAPLNRDQQIALMKDARERHQRRVAEWVDNRTVREALIRPAPGQDEQVSYERQTRRVACC